MPLGVSNATSGSRGCVMRDTVRTVQCDSGTLSLSELIGGSYVAISRDLTANYPHAVLPAIDPVWSRLVAGPCASLTVKCSLSHTVSSN